MSAIRSETSKIVLILLLVCAVAATVKIGVLGVTPSSDSREYIRTAMFFAGGEVEPAANRLLKPLCMVLLALFGPVMGYDHAVLAQSLLFYGGFVIVLYLLGYAFTNDRSLALCVALGSALSYPILRYGVDVYVETGALFFYALSLLLTLRFLERPTRNLFFWNVAVVTLGFLWKEYSIISGAIFGLAILLHPQLTPRVKALYAGAYIAIFLFVQLSWQAFVYMRYQYSYLYLLQVSSAGVSNGEYTVFNAVKSTAALLGLMWIVVPFGVLRIPSQELSKKLFIVIAALVPLTGYLFGYVQSRLLYVIAVPYLLIAALGMRSWGTVARMLFMTLVIVANIAWLFMSYRIRLS